MRVAGTLTTGRPERPASARSCGSCSVRASAALSISTRSFASNFEKRGGKWGLTFRHIAVEWAGKMAPMDFDLLTPPDAPKVRLGASRDRDDVSYLRPLTA